MNIQLFIFDWSGTISDDRHIVYEANKRLSKDYALEIAPFSQWLDEATMTAVDYYRERNIQEPAGDIMQKYKIHFTACINDGHKPCVFPDAFHALHQLKQQGATMAVVSAHPTHFLQEAITAYGMNGFFDLVEGSALSKTELIKSCAKILDTPLEQTIYTGDTIYDIQAAKAAGVHSAGVLTGYHTKEALQAEHPDHLFDNLTSLCQTFESEQPSS